jgi:hypothetical protein
MDVMQQDLRSTRVMVAQWVGVLGPPILWAIRFGVNYALMPLICAAELIWLPHTITAISLVLLAGMGWTAWRFWSGTRGARDAAPAGTSDLVRRTRFMGLFGMMSAALFTLAVLAEWLANVMIDPCLTAGPLVPH